MKAVMITRKNRAELEGRFCPEEDAREPLVEGYFLVAPFDSQDVFYDLLTFRQLMESYQVTGQRYKNGFFGVKDKVS